MGEYALTRDWSLRTDTSEDDDVRHRECGRRLTPIETEPGKYYCLYCLKTGWPVASRH